MIIKPGTQLKNKAQNFKWYRSTETALISFLTELKYLKYKENPISICIYAL